MKTLNGKNIKTKIDCQLCLTVIHFVCVVVFVLWTPNNPKENKIAVNIWSNE